jgi:hypothetical protein
MREKEDCSMTKITDQELQEVVSALREVDRLAEAGLCYRTAAGKHEFLADIRSVISVAGVSGGLTPPPYPPRRAALDFQRKLERKTSTAHK